MNTYKNIFRDKKRVLVVTAHPDDADVFFGGTISRLREDKKDVFVLVMTNGARGSRESVISEDELANKRIEEQRRALKEYGVPANHFNTLNYKDGEAQNSMELIGNIAYVVRKFKPDIVLTHNPNNYFSKSVTDDYYHVNHKDHRVCGISTLDAVYPFSRDRSFFIEHAKEGILPHTSLAMLFTAGEEANTEIDITGVIDKKKNGLARHKSQFDKETVERILEGGKVGEKNIERGFYITLRG
jgi:LmbE family N-acetylglucosaminyl deacetylase